MFWAWLALPAIALAAEQPTLTVSTYDTLAAEGGWGAAVFQRFEKRCGCKVRVLTAGDAGQIVARLRLDAERGKPSSQVLLGIDQNTWHQARAHVEPWGEWRPRGYGKLLAETRVEEGFLPFDHGAFAFIADRDALREAGLAEPSRLDDLLAPGWKRNVILQDPRTSTPGLAFVLWASKSKDASFWGRFRAQWLTLAPGWDAAYALFLKKEAPLVWSYVTSQAYHAEHGDRAGRYRALLFEEGQPLQIEGAALVKGALEEPGARDRARAFLEYLISPEAQALVPRTNWMLPALKGVKLPESFRRLPKPKRLVRVDASAADVDRALAEWSRAIR
jgi:thiamine transport system substrate-binding protein